jgi:TorA maturation chaperone TorD
MSVQREAGVETGSIQAWLTQAAGWMFASLVFQPPDQARIDEMTALLPTLPAQLREAAAQMVALPADQWEPEFFSVLGPAGCPASESSYERAAFASRGPLLTEVAGTYAAFAYPGEHIREVPDHIAVETGFLSFLAMKVAFARFASRGEEESIAREAYDTFRDEHVRPWAGAFCDALAESGSEHYATAGEYLRLVLTEAC